MGRPLFISFVVSVVLATAACRPPYLGGDDDSPDAAGDDPPLRTCLSKFTYPADSGVQAVEVAGQWDWSGRTPLADADQDGVYTAELELAPGLWAYKLIVTRASGPEVE